MAELCWGILFLGIAAAVNWALGLYDKIGVEKLTWDWKEFARGAIKIGILVGSVIGLGVAWQFSGIDLSGAGVEPLTLTTGATTYYAFRAIKHLATIVKGNKTEAITTDDNTTGGEG